MAKRRRVRRVLPATAARRTGVATPNTAQSVRRGLVGAAGVVLLVLVGFLAFVAPASSPGYTCSELLAPGADGGTISPPNIGSEHVEPGTEIEYPSCPPTSGRHYNARGLGPLAPGFYEPSSPAGPGGWVHNLEHGYVVALYRCDEGGCPQDDVFETMRSFASTARTTQSATACGYRTKVVVARFDDMATEFAFLAWDRALLVNEFDKSAALDFARQSLEATAPEPNAC